MVALALAWGSAMLVGCGSVPSAGTSSPMSEAPGRADDARHRGITPPPAAVQQFEQAVAAMKAGDLAAAQEAFQGLAQAYPSYSSPLLNLGILLVRQGRLPQAEEALRAAVGRNDGNAPAFNQLGILYRRLGRFGEAEAAYRRALAADPEYALAHLNLGVLCDLYLQQPQCALEAYQRYLALASPPDARVSIWIKDLRMRLGARAGGNDGGDARS